MLFIVDNSILFLQTHPSGLSFEEPELLDGIRFVLVGTKCGHRDSLGRSSARGCPLTYVCMALGRTSEIT